MDRVSPQYKPLFGVGGLRRKTEDWIRSQSGSQTHADRPLHLHRAPLKNHHQGLETQWLSDDEVGDYPARFDWGSMGGRQEDGCLLIDNVWSGVHVSNHMAGLGSCYSQLPTPSSFFTFRTRQHCHESRLAEGAMAGSKQVRRGEASFAIVLSNL